MEIKDINLEEYEISEQAEELIVLRKKSKYPKWEDLKELNGVYIETSSETLHREKARRDKYTRNTFLSEKHAKSALAMAQISQLMPYYGGEITDEEWEDRSIRKYIIFRRTSYIGGYDTYSNYEFLAFRTAEQRDEFLKNNEQLVKDYLMIE